MTFALLQVLQTWDIILGHAGFELLHVLQVFCRLQGSSRCDSSVTRLWGRKGHLQLPVRGDVTSLTLSTRTILEPSGKHEVHLKKPFQHCALSWER